MATLIVTPSALACIRERIEYEEIQRPVVAVSWQLYADNRTGSDGKLIWEQPTMRWLITVFDLAELEKEGISWTRPVLQLHGYSFSLMGKPEAPQLQGCTLTCENGRLVVYEQAI